MGVLGYGRDRVCWGHVLGGYTLEMGHRDGALCTHLKFRDRYNYKL